jgi:acetyl esterase
MLRRQLTSRFYLSVLSAIAVALLANSVCLAQRKDKPTPTFRNISYGPHERNVLDIWQAQSEQPTPLVVYIHGGGFRNGSKDSIDADMLRALLKAKISVAALNYRLVGQAPLPAAHDDCRRALQFLRSKAEEWGLDKTRVGAFGGSAGAQLCMYLAFHDEMAKPGSDDPVERESTRLTCIATNGGQTTMDVDWWQKHVPDYTAPHRDFLEGFGVKTQEDFQQKVAQVSALSLITKDDPPIFMSYLMQPDDPVPPDLEQARRWKVHHVIFGIELKKRMDALGIEADLEYPGAKTIYRSPAEFIISKLSKPTTRD